MQDAGESGEDILGVGEVARSEAAGATSEEAIETAVINEGGRRNVGGGEALPAL